MDLVKLNRKFNSEAKALSYLEKTRWGKTVTCPFCGSNNVKRLKSEVKRHHCNSCKRHFSVLNGTIFEHTRLPMRKWFTLITLMLNAKQGISAMNLKRNLNTSYKTCWYAAMRVRCAMIDDCTELQNIVEMDEAFLGGKPRKKNERPPDNVPSLSTVTNKRGKGTSKTSVAGIVERDGQIVLKVMEKVTTRNLMAMLKRNVNLEKSIVITDAAPAYKAFDKVVEHLTINHKKEGFTRGAVNTSTVDGFWAILKNSLRGQYIALSKTYLPLYLVQSSYVYNRRKTKINTFDEFIKRALTDEKCLLYYKPQKPVKSFVYPKKKKPC
jgi:transposase-like protein